MALALHGTKAGISYLEINGGGRKPEAQRRQNIGRNKLEGINVQSGMYSAQIISPLCTKLDLWE